MHWFVVPCVFWPAGFLTSLVVIENITDIFLPIWILRGRCGRWWLCVLMICLGFHLFINLRWKLVLLFLSYFFLWSTKVMFRDNDENETKIIITYYDSISSLSKNQKTEVWWKLLLSFLQWLDRAMTMTGAEKKLAMSSQFHFHDDQSWKKATNIMSSHIHVHYDRRWKKQRYVFTLWLSWWPEQTHYIDRESFITVIDWDKALP